MGEILNIRAAEITALREKNRHLRRRIADINNIAAENDAMIVLLHRLSLLLIARKKDWHADAELLLRRGFKAAACQITVLKRGDTVLNKKIAALPLGGRTDKEPLVVAIGGATSGVKVYYHLPLRSARKNIGLLTFVMRNEVQAGDDDFCQRLSALLAAAL
ncbi:MAG: hypothetical protein ACNYPH_06400 [Gammaproteobacteria bacterium WSBS_2016_MAG_OTU1]